MFSDNYAVKSLELHLFFGRIMKEHALFLEAGFTPANPEFSKKADFFKREFEKLLCETIHLSNGIVRSSILHSGEVVTEFTALAEKQTECFTGISIDKSLTAKAHRLGSGCRGISNETIRRVRQINETALRLLDGLIMFKETVLKKVLCCEMFTANYPLLIEHILREAKLYREFVQTLECDGDLPEQSMRESECFWNQIMMEHAMFIRGSLDSTEKDLFCTANGFAEDYCALLEACHDAQIRSLHTESLEKTVKFRDFKAAGAKGIEQCKIRSVILPLLADHVLREANHYIRLLKQ